MKNCHFCEYKGTLSKRVLSRHKFLECGLNNITLVKSVIEFKCPNCGEVYLEYPKLSSLHEAIAKILVFKKGLLDKNEIIFLRKTLGYDLKSFALLLNKSPEYYGKVEKGTNNVSKELDWLIRFTYLSGPINRNYDEQDSFRHTKLIEKKLYDCNSLKLSYAKNRNTWEPQQIKILQA